MSLEDLTLGQLADAATELRELRRRLAELLAANTREVERRRRAELVVLDLFRVTEREYWAEDMKRLRWCPSCNALDADPCRTEETMTALPDQHAERFR